MNAKAIRTGLAAALLGLGLAVGTICAKEVDMGVAAIPAACIHIGPALETQRQLLLARGNSDGCAERLILKAAHDIDNHIAPREPALAGAVGVGIANLSKP